jgi:FkbM family methyltransferase
MKSLIRTLRFILSHPLNQHHKAHAVSRYLKWQIGSRLVPGPVLVDWIAGTRVIVRSGETGITQNLYCGLHDFEDMAYVLHVTAPEDLFFDIGANVGSYTVLACAARGARGVCFEPIPSTYKRLLDNIAINDVCSRVRALNVGLSNKDGTLNFTSNQNTTNHVLDDHNDLVTSIPIAVCRLDSVMRNESPSLMKIDVEGFETAVLDGATETLRNPSLHSILIELNGSGLRYGLDDAQTVRKLRSYGFLPYSYSPFTRELRRREGINSAGNNTLFVRDESLVRQRLRCTPRFRVHSYEL